MHPNRTTNIITYSNPLESFCPTLIETDRLQLRAIQTSFINIHKLHNLFSSRKNSDEIFRYCSWNFHENIEDTENFVESRDADWINKKRASYVITNKDTKEYIGTSYMKFTDARKQCTFGMWLRKQSWGNGFSSERADAFVHIAFNELDLKCVNVGCLKPNIKSKKSIEKYIKRYNGAYYGAKPVPSNRYGYADGVEIHHEYAVTLQQFNSYNCGIDCTIPGVSFEDINFDYNI